MFSHLAAVKNYFSLVLRVVFSLVENKYYYATWLELVLVLRVKHVFWWWYGGQCNVRKVIIDHPTNFIRCIINRVTHALVYRDFFEQFLNI